MARFIGRALAEDVGDGDITSQSVIPEDARLRAAMVAREPLVLAGLPLAIAIVKRLAPDAIIDTPASDGDTIAAGDMIALIDGPARALLTAERTALNIVQHLSGIASLTRRYVERTQGTGAQVLDTRKTIPGLRALAKYAVRMGGGRNHRMGLYDAVLIKDNHIAIAGDVATAIRRARAHGQREIEVECDRLEQVRAALDAGATRLLLDNMPPETLRQAVALVGGRIPLEASGGVTLETIADIARTGVDYISVGRLTQSAPAVDIGLDYQDRPDHQDRAK
jgi:nicotinate-nucleotide pyrophosphorylase (carboxylating)